MNFTKPKRATIRYTKSQWLSEDPTEAPVGRVAVPKTGQTPPSSREDATEAPVGKVAVKNPVVNPTLTRQQYRFPSLRHATLPQNYLWAGWSCRRQVRSPPLPRRDGSGVLVGRVAVPKQIVRRIIMVEVKVLVGYAPWQMVSGGIGSRKGKGPTKWEGPPGTICHGAIMDRLFLRRRHRLPKREGAHEVGRPSRHHLSRSNHGPAISPA